MFFFVNCSRLSRWRSPKIQTIWNGRCIVHSNCDPVAPSPLKSFGGFILRSSSCVRFELDLGDTPVAPSILMNTKEVNWRAWHGFGPSLLPKCSRPRFFHLEWLGPRIRLHNQVLKPSWVVCGIIFVWGSTQKLRVLREETVLIPWSSKLNKAKRHASMHQGQIPAGWHPIAKRNPPSRRDSWWTSKKRQPFSTTFQYLPRLEKQNPQLELSQRKARGPRGPPWAAGILLSFSSLAVLALYFLQPMVTSQLLAVYNCRQTDVGGVFWWVRTSVWQRKIQA